MDLVWCVLLGAFFVLLVWLTAACERLMSRR
jgi:hypothetical protein